MLTRGGKVKPTIHVCDGHGNSTIKAQLGPALLHLAYDHDLDTSAHIRVLRMSRLLPQLSPGALYVVKLHRNDLRTAASPWLSLVTEVASRLQARLIDSVEVMPNSVSEMLESVTTLEGFLLFRKCR